jgi:hypothetical protein
MTRDNVTELIVFNRAKKKVTWAALATAVVGRFTILTIRFDDSLLYQPRVSTIFAIDVTFVLGVTPTFPVETLPDDECIARPDIAFTAIKSLSV